MRVKFIAGMLALFFIAACQPDHPHYTQVCIASHKEDTVDLMPFPDGNGGTMMIPMPSTTTVCDQYRTYCEHNSKEISDRYCQMMRELK